LEEIDGVTVKSTKIGSTIHIGHLKHHALDFVFRWGSDHFIGYFVDAEKAESQAVLSLYTSMDAIRFATAYALLVELRARKKGA
jgi:hypothetical protein